MAIQAREGDLVLGTFGRAAYVIEDLSPLRALANEGAALLNTTFRAFDAASGYQVPRPRPAGSRFMADHVWEGKNRNRNAHGHVYVQADTAEVHSEMEVVILTAEGDTLRRMTREVEAGWQTLTWRGDTDGIPLARSWTRQGRQALGWRSFCVARHVHCGAHLGNPRGFHGHDVGVRPKNRI